MYSVIYTHVGLGVGKRVAGVSVGGLVVEDVEEGSFVVGIVVCVVGLHGDWLGVAGWFIVVGRSHGGLVGREEEGERRRRSR